MFRGATFSDCGTYRYSLTRRWGAGAPLVFCMLNPSTANAEHDDPTIRKCLGFAERWHYKALEVVNLFAYRSTSPHVLPTIEDPFGPQNAEAIAAATRRTDRVICGWGAHGTLHGADALVLKWLNFARPGVTWALNINKNGTPQHPLYVSYEVEAGPGMAVRLPVPLKANP
jgi:hypothetical protein